MNELNEKHPLIPFEGQCGLEEPTFKTYFQNKTCLVMLAGNIL